MYASTAWEACMDHTSITLTWDSEGLGIGPWKIQTDLAVEEHKQAELAHVQQTVQA